MRHSALAFGLAIGTIAGVFASMAEAAPCLKVTLTGTQGGPPVFNGLSGSGTLVEFGDEENGCSDMRLQFDAGRGTTQQLSKLGVSIGQLKAVFLTHLHSDHTDGLADMMQLRWHFNSAGPKLDLVCTNDTKSPAGHVMSCAKLAAHIADPFIQSGEMAQRLAENDTRLPGGPADLINLSTFEATDDATTVWSSGEVKVSAIASRHIAGHASFRVDTPAGSVVIGGDAGNNTTKPPRSSSTSDQVEELAMGADVIVHSAIHPAMGPDNDSGFPLPIYFRQSTATDLGALAARTGARYLMLTHLIPPMGAVKQGPFPIPGGPLTEASYMEAVSEGGFQGNIIVGTDLASVTLVKQ